MKKYTIRLIIAIGTVAVFAIWVGWAFIRLNHPVEKWGVFGDKYGALNTLFTGLAFVGVIAALWHEREGAAEREHEHQELLAAMKQQADEAARATRVNILIAKLGSIDTQAAAGSRAMAVFGSFRRSQIMDQLNKELYGDGADEADEEETDSD